MDTSSVAPCFNGGIVRWADAQLVHNYTTSTSPFFLDARTVEFRCLLVSLPLWRRVGMAWVGESSVAMEPSLLNGISTMILDDTTVYYVHLQWKESQDHLFLKCPFVQQCWQLLNLHIASLDDPLQMILAFKNQLNVPFYMDVIILMCWAIWMVRNDAIFKGIQPSIQGCATHFKKEYALATLRAKKDHPYLMNIWLEDMM